MKYQLPLAILVVLLICAGSFQLGRLENVSKIMPHVKKLRSNCDLWEEIAENYQSTLLDCNDARREALRHLIENEDVEVVVLEQDDEGNWVDIENEEFADALPESTPSWFKAYPNGTLWSLAREAGIDPDNFEKTEEMVEAARLHEIELRKALKLAGQIRERALWVEADDAELLKEDAKRRRSQAWADYRERLAALVALYTEDRS